MHRASVSLKTDFIATVCPVSRPKTLLRSDFTPKRSPAAEAIRIPELALLLMYVFNPLHEKVRAGAGRVKKRPRCRLISMQTKESDVISEKMQAALNDQIKAELYSGYLYLAMAAWSEDKNLEGCANWMRQQANEELFHAMKFIDYMNMAGGRVILQAVEAPQSEWDSPQAIFEASLAHERHMTKLINILASLAIEEKDHATGNMLQWFVNEQVEEEASVDAILQKLNLTKDSGAGLFMIDRELVARPAPTPPAAE